MESDYLKSDEKIKSKKEISNIANELRENGKKIVTTNGAFDLLHSGHLKSIETAKSLGDVLIVCLNSDESVRRYKSPLRPIISEKHRARMLAALTNVDYVVIFEEDDPRSILESIKPNIHVKSKSGYKGIEKEVVEKYGGEIRLIDDVAGLSTTDIVKKIIEIENSEKRKNHQ